MSESVHGHEVMHFMVESGRSFSRENLIAAVTERFGPETRFHTCSAEGMTAAQLVDFLAAKGKFVEADGGFNMQPDRICNH
jgi:probable metal-binding protein